MVAQASKCETARDGFLGELTDTALRVASRHGVNGFSVDQEIDLWKRLGEVLRRWQANPHREALAPEALSAELAEAAYENSLHKGFRGSFLDLQLDFWRALRQTTTEGYWSERYWSWLCWKLQEVTTRGHRFAQMAVA